MKKYLERIYGKSKNEYCTLLSSYLRTEEKRFVITVNPEILMSAENDDTIDSLLTDSITDLVPDGIAVVKACSDLGIPVTEKIAGVELAEWLIEELDRQGGSLYLFGASSDVVSALAEKIKSEYPNVRLSGFSDGYVKDKDGVFSEIVRLSPDVCMVALGVPMQEKLIYKHLPNAEKGIFIGVGGSFDVLSGAKKRAPDFFVRHRLEWLYRIAKEPKRIKRFYQSNVKFVLKINKMKK